MQPAEITGSVAAAEKILRGENIYAVTDSNVAAFYGALFSNKSAFVINAGEKSKNLETVGKILADMTAAGCNRGTTLIAVGGGVVGDTGGFAAAMFMRGIKWVNIPTTLLAEIDSGIGGKTGVDVRGYKNIAGSFHMPERVVICTDFLKTLPGREWFCGLGEAVKHALICRELYDFTRDNFDRLIARDEDIAREIVERNARFKEEVVSRDFKESGLRKILNAGHTVGHALEKSDGFALSHGHYVALGLAAEMRMFREHIEPDFFDEAIQLTKRICDNMPKVSINDILGAARADKKNAGGKLSFMIAIAPGGVKEFLIGEDEFLERAQCIYSR